MRQFMIEIWHRTDANICLFYLFIFFLCTIYIARSLYWVVCLKKKKGLYWVGVLKRKSFELGPVKIWTQGPLSLAITRGLIIIRALSLSLPCLKQFGSKHS